MSPHRQFQSDNANWIARAGGGVRVAVLVAVEKDDLVEPIVQQRQIEFVFPGLVLGDVMGVETGRQDELLRYSAIEGRPRTVQAHAELECFPVTRLNPGFDIPGLQP